MIRGVFGKALVATETIMRRLGLSRGAGTGAGQVVVLDGSGALPAVDGSNLIGLSGGAFTIVNSEADLDAAIAADDQMVMVKTSFALTGDKVFDYGDHVIQVAPGVELDLAGFELIESSGQELNIRGPGTVKWSRASGQPIDLSAGAIVRCRDVKLTNEGTGINTYFATSNQSQYYRGVYLTPGNASTAGVYCQTAGFSFVDCEVNGSGTNCDRALKRETNGGHITGVIVTGDFKNSSSAPCMELENSELIVSNMDFTGLGLTPTFLFLSGYVTNVLFEANSPSETYIFTDRTMFCNFRHGNGTLRVLADEARLSQMYVLDIIINARNTSISSSSLRFNFDLDTDDLRIIDCDILQTSSDMQITADRCQVLACRFDDVTTTIDITATANDAHVGWCHTKAAVTDAGTTSIVANNSTS